MLHLPSNLLIQIEGLDESLSMLSNNDSFPTIDVDALLSGIIEALCVNEHVRIENILYHLMYSDFICDRLTLDDVVFVKIEAIIYKLLTIIQSRLVELCLYKNSIIPYTYKHRRRKNEILLTRRFG